MSWRRIRPAGSLLGVWTLVALAGTMGLAGCRKQGASGPLKVGAIMPLTGELAAFGVPVREGMEFALQEVNDAGGVGGRQLQIVFEDDRGEPPTAVSAFNKLISVDGVKLILGPLTSGASLATAPVAERSHVVQFSTLAGTVALKNAGDYVFRLYPSSEYQAAFIADAARSRLGKQRAAILYVNNAYGQSSSRIVRDRFTAAGGQIVATESFEDGATDFRTQLTRIRQQNPDLVFGLAYWREGAQLLKQAQQLGLNVPVLGEDSWYGPVEEIAGDATRALVFGNVAFGEEYRDSPAMQQFISRFRAAKGKNPDAYAAVGYDAVKIAARVLERGGDNADAIRDGLYHLQGYTGALGTVRFDRFGDNVGGRFDLYTLRGGELVRYGSVGAAVPTLPSDSVRGAQAAAPESAGTRR